MWPLLIMAGASMLSNYLGSKSQKKQTSTSTSTPSFNPAMSPLIGPLVSSSLNRMQNAGLPPGYEAQGIDKINQTYNAMQQGLQNRMTSQGLGGSPIAGSGMATLEAGRGGQIAGFRTDLPLVQQQMQDQANRQAMMLLGMGQGQTTTGTTIGGETNPTAAAFGTGLGDISSMMAYLYGTGYMQPKAGTLASTSAAPWYLAAPKPTDALYNPWGTLGQGYWNTSDKTVWPW